MVLAYGTRYQRAGSGDLTLAVISWLALIATPAWMLLAILGGV